AARGGSAIGFGIRLRRPRALLDLGPPCRLPTAGRLGPTPTGKVDVVNLTSHVDGVNTWSYRPWGDHGVSTAGGRNPEPPGDYREQLARSWWSHGSDLAQGRRVGRRVAYCPLPPLP